MRGWFVFWGGIFSAQVAFSQNFSAPYAPGYAGVGLSLSETEYEVEDSNAEFEPERRTLGFEWHGQGTTSPFFQLGYTVDSEIGNNDGSGFVLGAGASHIFKQTSKFKVGGRLGWFYLKEDYDDGDLSYMEVMASPYLLFNVDPAISLYTAMDISLYSDGKYESDSGFDFDFEKDQIIGLKFGLQYALTKTMILRPEVTILSEESFQLAVMFKH